VSRNASYRLASAVVASALVCAGHAAAEPPLGHGSEAQVFQLDASARFTVAHAPFFTEAFPVLDAHGVSFTLDARYRLSPGWSLGARLPLTALSVRQPAGSYLDEAAWGNPTLSVTRSIEAALLGRRGLAAWLAAEVGVPLAEYGPADALLENRALEAANAAEAYLSPESYLPATLPFVVRSGGRFADAPWSAEAELAVPLLVRLGDADLPAAARAHRLGFWPSVQLTGAFQATRWLRASLGANAAVAAARVFEPWHEVSRWQASLRAGLTFRPSQRLELGLTFLAPVAGALGGEVYSGGMTLEVQR
jgi:hypothetical protein